MGSCNFREIRQISYPMTDAELIEYITGTFAHIVVASSDGNSFFFYSPDGKVPDKTFPFTTLVTRDDYDAVSNLGRPGVWRLNIGVKKSKFDALFQEGAEHDFTAQDIIMPHPVYGNMAWICVLNPGPITWPTVQEFLAEAYQTAVKKSG